MLKKKKNYDSLIRGHNYSAHMHNAHTILHIGIPYNKNIFKKSNNERVNSSFKLKSYFKIPVTHIF